MALAKDVLASELDKLKKSEIIELLVYGKLPSNKSESEKLNGLRRLLDILWKNEVDIREDGVFYDTSKNTVDQGGCSKQTCIEYRVQAEVSVHKEQAHRGLISQFEKRVENLEEIIGLLKLNQQGSKVVHSEPPVANESSSRKYSKNNIDGKQNSAENKWTKSGRSK
ncbi:unnamed protein product [Callosobruchus maculatus]|uniref:Uncharacterized protein n=1 Tax=Callosobruchus maculatus TaxID=64391 RepID=A0A653DBI2_CALMS|nr:unnamed protein product [Callosobruchus maculatus]